MQHERISPYHGDESLRDSLESSEVSSSDAFNNNNNNNFCGSTSSTNNIHHHNHYFQRNRINHITQHIQNNNNKITIIIKHDNDGPHAQLNANVPQIIYIQPASSQPNLNAINNQTIDSNLNAPEIYNSLDDLDTDEHYQFYNESAIDVPDDFKRDSYLVLNLNDAANKRLKRRICTPTRTLLPLPSIPYPNANGNKKYSTMNGSVSDKSGNFKGVEEESRRMVSFFNTNEKKKIDNSLFAKL
jgi:hypothetical protein